MNEKISKILAKYQGVHSPGYVIEILANKKRYSYVSGYREEVPKKLKMLRNTLFDVASITKVFTSTLIYMAIEENKLKLDDTIYKISNDYTKLKKVTILDLLSHQKNLYYDSRLKSARTKEEFYKYLFSTSVKSNYPTYSDISYMILTDILEKIYNEKFDKLMQQKIFDKLNLKTATFNPNSKNVASCNYENNITNVYPGTIHDPKASLAKKLGIITGHASLFITGFDLLKFLESFFSNKLLKKETISLMLNPTNVNKMNLEYLNQIAVGKDINELYKNALLKNKKLIIPNAYNYMGARIKDDIKIHNSIPNNFSLNSMSASGYTGSYFAIDFDKKKIVVIMCNPVHNMKVTSKQKVRITRKIANKISELTEICYN